MRKMIIALAAGAFALSAAQAVEPLGDELLWLPIGDSITEGEKFMGHEGEGNASTRGGYRYQVWKALEAAGQRVRTVGFRTGHSGTVEDPATCRWAYHAGQYGGVIVHDNGGTHGAAGFNVENTLALAGYPDIITVLIGVNDLSFSGKNTTAIEPEYILVYETMREMVEKIARLRPQSKIYVVSILPAGGGRNYIVGYNTYLRQQNEANAAPFGLANVEFLDINRDVFNETFTSAYFKSDVIHPNETGSVLVAGGFTNAIWRAIGEIADSDLAPVAVDNARAGYVRVLCNKKIGSGETASVRLVPASGGEAVELSNPTTVEGRSFLFAVKTSFASGPYSADVTIGDATTTLPAEAVQVYGTGAAANVPAALREKMVKYKTISIGTNDNWQGYEPAEGEGLVTADLDFRKIDRVGYYLELKRPDKPAQFAWASFDATPFGGKLARCGLPAVRTGNYKSLVTNLQVYATHLVATNADETGVIEFSPYDWSGTDQSGCPRDLFSGKCGWNDTLGTSALKGCLQIARSRNVASPDTYTNVAAELVFAFNNFHSDKATDAGIGSFSTHKSDTSGNSSTPSLDWTDFNETTKFADFAMDAYETRTLEIWVSPSEDQTADPAVTDHLTSSYVGGVWTFPDSEAETPFGYAAGSSTSLTMTLQILASLPRTSGVVAGWLVNSIPIQLVYNAETDLFNVTYSVSSSHSATVCSTPQDVTQTHLYTICASSESGDIYKVPGVRVYQDGNLIVYAPGVKFSNNEIKPLVTIGDDVLSRNPLTGMSVYAVDVYYPNATLDTTRAFSTFGGLPSDASLDQKIWSVARACDKDGLLSFAPVTVNGVVRRNDEAANLHYMFDSDDATTAKSYSFSLLAPQFDGGKVTLGLGADDPVKAYLTLETCEDLSAGVWSKAGEIAPGASRSWTLSQEDLGTSVFFRASAARTATAD